MSIWYDGSNLNMYRGDTGSIIFKNLPCCTGYRVFFSVKSEVSNEIIFESSGDPEYYYIDNEGIEYEKNSGETEEEFITRMEALVESGEAIKKGKCRIYISAEKTEKLFVLKGEAQRKYYFGLKICFTTTGVENTLIPQTVRDEETGKIIFKDPPELIVKPKYAEGLLPCQEYDEFDVAIQNPADYGLQPLITPILPLKWGENWELRLDPKTQEIFDENLKLKEDVEQLKITVGDEDRGLVHDVNDMSDRITSQFQIIGNLENLVNGCVETVDEMQSTVTGLSDRIDETNGRIDDLQETVDGFGDRFDGIDERLDGVDERFDGIDERFDGIDEHINDLQETVDGLGDMAWESTDDWQRKLEPGEGIDIDENNVISVTYTPAVRLEDLVNVEITNLKNGDILVYNFATDKWVNKPYNPQPITDEVDGGKPDTEDFDEEIDGGTPSTQDFPDTIDGGFPNSIYTEG